MKYLWVAYSREDGLPIFVGDSARELAEKLGVHKSTVTYQYRYTHGLYKGIKAPSKYYNKKQCFDYERIQV